jgi:hypothetical protein
LKVKIKSLAAEAVIIRQEERKNSGATRFTLHQHRVFDVRKEARCSLIAYGYLRGRPLASFEKSGSRKPDWGNAERIAKRFSLTAFNQQHFREWAGIEPAQAKAA